MSTHDDLRFLYYSREQERQFDGARERAPLIGFEFYPAVAVYRTTDGRDVEVTEARSTPELTLFPDAEMVGIASRRNFVGRRAPRSDA
jgi:hypothetical protein